MFKDIIIYTPMYVTLFWAVVLLSSKQYNNRAKFFLGIFMSVAFILYLSHAVYFKQHNNVFIYFDPLYIFSSLSVYPLYYWYIRLLTSDVNIEHKNLRLLIPALVLGFATFVVYLFMSPLERRNYVDGFLFNLTTTQSDPLISLQKGINVLSRLVFIIQIVIYVVLGVKLVKNYNWRIANFYSNLENRTIVWVKMLLISFVFTSAVSVISVIVGRMFFLYSTYMLIIPSLVFSVLLFIIGFQGYLQNYTVADLVKDENTQPGIDLEFPGIKVLKERLLKLFDDDTIYRNPNLKLTNICVLLQTNRTYISNLINSEFSCSFSEFVNNYRIAEVKRMLTDDAYKNYSLISISEDVGFGSLATFIRVFKEKEGVPPGKYRQIYGNR